MIIFKLFYYTLINKLKNKTKLGNSVHLIISKSILIE